MTGEWCCLVLVCCNPRIARHQILQIPQLYLQFLGQVLRMIVPPVIPASLDCCQARGAFLLKSG